MKNAFRLTVTIVVSAFAVATTPHVHADDDQDNAQGIQNALRESGNNTPARNDVNRNMDEGDQSNGRDSHSPPPNWTAPKGKDGSAN
jgi:hypothetical protein